MTRILGILLTCAIVPIVFAAQDQGPGKDESIDKLGKEMVRLMNAIADETEALLDSPDEMSAVAGAERIKKAAAELQERLKEARKLPPAAQADLNAKLKKDAESAIGRTQKARAKLGLPDMPLVPQVDGKEKKGEAKKDSLEEIIKRLGENMEKASDRLSMKDPGKETVKIQDDIVKDLDELLKQNDPNGGGSSSSSSNGQSGPSSGTGGPSGGPSGTKGGVGQKGSQGAGKKEENKGASSANGKDDKKKSGGGTGVNKDKDADNKLTDFFPKDGWGYLPERKRKEMDAYSKVRLVPNYEEILRQYYRTIAEQGRKE